jgi:hypothetical protein
MTDEPKQPEGNERRIKQWGAFAGVLQAWERAGIFDMIETGTKLTCDKCGRVTYTGRGAKADSVCYRVVDEKNCLGKLRRTK